MPKPFSGLAALTVSVLVFSIVLLVGCGGGEEPAPETTVPPPSAAVVAQPVINASAVQHTYEGLVGTSLEPTDDTPQAVRTALDEGRPVVVLFYVAGGHDDSLVRASVDKLMPQYEEMTLAAFDFKTPDAFGDLARLLEIDYPPQLVFIDTAGVVRSVLSGYVDEGTLNQHLVNIRQG